MSFSKKMSKWDDKEALDHFIEFLDRVSLTTMFVVDEKTGVIDRQILVIQSGDYAIQSEPMPLDTPVVPANLGGALN